VLITVIMNVLITVLMSDSVNVCDNDSVNVMFVIMTVSLLILTVLLLMSVALFVCDETVLIHVLLRMIPKFRSTLLAVLVTSRGRMWRRR